MLIVKSIDKQSIEISPTAVVPIYEKLGIVLNIPSNGWYTTLCPFHLEKNPSCGIHSTSGGYNCFSCGATGSIFDAIMKLSPGEIDFKQALEVYKSVAGDELTFKPLHDTFAILFEKLEFDIVKILRKKNSEGVSIEKQEEFWQWYDFAIIKWFAWMEKINIPSAGRCAAFDQMCNLTEEENDTLLCKLVIFKRKLKEQLHRLDEIA